MIIQRRAQQGATLIIVLMILLLIIIIGTLAVKQSLVSLNIATAGQAQQLLFENSDTALFRVEDPKQVETQLAANGMFAYFDSSDHAQDQLVFCYEGKNDNFFSLQNASVISSDGTITKNGSAGFCTEKSYTTGRSAIVSQVYLSLASASSQPLVNLTVGMSTGQTANISNATKQITVTVISVLPGLTAYTPANLEACFKKNQDDVGACFKQLNVPYNIQRADYTVSAAPTLKTS
ncbi:pilus assembly protein PilX [Acinetobacter sp. MD2(2019)]|uniref:pilus assembly protein PilX n=1 Tax=Acinetobacter sp. MD2(2019) TaxID=2605273 RepID=UPI002D1E7E1D|nr:pilus assembly protein PilX [Acinetobacter sp. MD2(2019)]MEB3753251.1 pilus assembly protein PilX [Acinetobacter sp. MD2(2019)]